jgi:hypothetical protein
MMRNWRFESETYRGAGTSSPSLLCQGQEKEGEKEDGVFSGLRLKVYQAPRLV